MNGHYVVKRDNKIYEEFDVIDGYLDGIFIRFQKNGNVELYETYSKSYLHGKSYETYENGAIKKEVVFTNGIKDSVEVYYDTYGNLASKKIVNDGIEYEHHYKNDERITTVFKKEINEKFFDILIKYSDYGTIDFILGKSNNDQDPVLYLFNEDYQIIEEMNVYLDQQRIQQYLQAIPKF